jgi:starvation-inducible DNA-binding protein
MHPSPSALSPDTRTKLIAELNARLVDGVDLYTQVKAAHWNVKGDTFMPLHQMFDKLAEDVEDYNDDIAERAVILGGDAQGTARDAAARSRLPPFDQATTTPRATRFVKVLVDRLDVYLVGLRVSRDFSRKVDDQDTFELLTTTIMAVEKWGWFLRATLES